VGALGIAINKSACPSIIVIAASIQLYPPELYERGLHCIIASIMRTPANSLSPRIKSLNYLNNIMAKCEAIDNGADEAIMLNHQGQVTEGTGDNLFMVENGTLYTPPTNVGILEGITRGVVMELASQRGLPFEEKVLTLYDLYAADEIFMTGTAAEIIAVVSVNKRRVSDGKPGPITRQLRQDFVAYRSR